MHNQFVKLQRLTMECKYKDEIMFYLMDENVCLSLINVASFTHKIMGFYHNESELLGDSDNPKMWGMIGNSYDLYADFRQMLNMDNFMLVKVGNVEYYINIENLLKYYYVNNYGYELYFKDGRSYGIETSDKIIELDSYTTFHQ